MSSDSTPNLALPYIAAGQAQKHVTHNEALRDLDALVQLSVKDIALTTPPASPQEGDRYIVPSGATGAWSGQASRIAAFQDGGWNFLTPRGGWLAYIVSEARLRVWDGAAWVKLTAEVGNPVDKIGVATTADAVNRLSVASEASLFTHAGGSHRLKINRSATSETASVLFQSNYFGRAEMGLMGTDGFSFKVSANGTNWLSALSIDPATGYIGFGVAPTVRLDIGGPVRARGNSASPCAFFDGAGTENRSMTFSTNGIRRWDIGISSGETGSGNAGGNFFFNWSDDAGSYLGTALQIARASGVITTYSELQTSTVKPRADNYFTLGASGARWASVFAANGVIQTSDQRDKTDVEVLARDQAGRLVDRVAPVLFRWRIGGRTVEQDDPASGKLIMKDAPGRRRHAGFLAQEVHAAMTAEAMDFGAWGLDDPAAPESRQWLRPDQLIPVLWAALQETRAAVAELKRERDERA